MNEFFFTVIVLCVVCALLECLLPKKAGDLGALCSLFVVVCVLGAFTLSDGIEFPPSAPVAYDDMSDYAFRKACEERVTASSVQIVSQNGKSVEKLTLGTEKNDGLAARLREIFGCEVTFE